MPVEFQEFGPKLRRSATKVLLRERVQQLCVRLIVEPIFSGPVTSPVSKLSFGKSGWPAPTWPSSFR